MLKHLQISTKAFQAIKNIFCMEKFVYSDGKFRKEFEKRGRVFRCTQNAKCENAENVCSGAEQNRAGA